MTSHKVVGCLSLSGRNATQFEWTIVQFESLLDDHRGEFVDSPDFSFSGCTWYLQLYVCSRYEVCLCRRIKDLSSSTSARKTIQCIPGMKRSDGTLEEDEIVTHTFIVDGSRSCEIGGEFFPDRFDLIDRQAQLLPLGNFTITCYLMESEAPYSAGLVPMPSTLAGLKQLSSNFGELFANKKKCDVVIKVADSEFHAHKIVLMTRSPVFAAMFEHDTLEGETGIVTVPDCNPDSFDDFLEYLYTGRCESITPENAQHLYVTADKYDVPGLKSLCAVCINQNLASENFFDVVSFVDKYEDAELMYSVQSFFNQNVSTIFSTTEWETLLQTNHRLANRLLKEMVKDCSDQNKRRRIFY